MDRAGTYLLHLLDFLGFVLKLFLALIFGDFAEATRRSERIWLIVILLSGAAFVVALIHLANTTPR